MSIHPSLFLPMQILEPFHRQISIRSGPGDEQQAVEGFVAGDEAEGAGGICYVVIGVKAGTQTFVMPHPRVKFGLSFF